MGVENQIKGGFAAWTRCLGVVGEGCDSAAVIEVS
jgi:hypothetical protein